MINILLKYEIGRVILHFYVIADNINHFKNPHISFAIDGVIRYINGIG